jgi:hypothetical protein
MTTEKYDGVILSHTLEHIYNVPSMMKRIKSALKEDGFLFIEVPIHNGYKDPAEYDYQWQHINKFRPQDLENLLTAWGFEVVISVPLPDYRYYNVHRIVGKNATS